MSAQPGYAYPPPSPYAPPAPPRRGRGWLTCLAVLGCAGLALCGALVAGGGVLYYLVDSGQITQNQLLNLVGLGPAYIEVDNFRDEAVYVSITQEQVAEDDFANTGYLPLNPFDVGTYAAPEAGVYRLDFGLNTGTAELGSCTLTVAAGERYQFVTLPDTIAVMNVNNPSDAGPDFVVETSSLCG